MRMFKNPRSIRTSFIGDFYDFAGYIVSGETGYGIGYLHRKGNALIEKAKREKGVMRVVYNAAGFTLVELSIVLVIVGLLIGGILVAQSMINTTQLQAQVRQIQQYDILVSNFKQMYNCLPGDCTILIPAGNGNGKIWDAAGVGNDGISGEIPAFWKHLHDVGMINETYSAIPPLAFGEIIPGGIIMPQTVLNRDASVVASSAFPSISTRFPAGQALYTLSRHTYRSSDDTMLSPAFSVADVVALEEKMDDGVHHSGILRVVHSTSDIMSYMPAEVNGCTTGQNDGVYRIDSPGEVCAIAIEMMSQVGGNR